MSELVVKLRSAADFRREVNTLRAMLSDTVDALELMRDLSRDDQVNIVIGSQIEAINSVLTAGAKTD